MFSTTHGPKKHLFMRRRASSRALMTLNNRPATRMFSITHGHKKRLSVRRRASSGMDGGRSELSEIIAKYLNYSNLPRGYDGKAWKNPVGMRMDRTGKPCPHKGMLIPPWCYNDDPRNCFYCDFYPNEKFYVCHVKRKYGEKTSKYKYGEKEKWPANRIKPPTY